MLQRKSALSANSLFWKTGFKNHTQCSTRSTKRFLSYLDRVMASVHSERMTPSLSCADLLLTISPSQLVAGKKFRLKALFLHNLPPCDKASVSVCSFNQDAAGGASVGKPSSGRSSAMYVHHNMVREFESDLRFVQENRRASGVLSDAGDTPRLRDASCHSSSSCCGGEENPPQNAQGAASRRNSVSGGAEGVIVGRTQSASSSSSSAGATRLSPAKTGDAARGALGTAAKPETGASMISHEKERRFSDLLGKRGQPEVMTGSGWSVATLQFPEGVVLSGNVRIALDVANEQTRGNYDRCCSFSFHTHFTNAGGQEGVESDIMALYLRHLDVEPKFQSGFFNQHIPQKNPSASSPDDDADDDAPTSAEFKLLCVMEEVGSEEEEREKERLLRVEMERNKGRAAVDVAAGGRPEDDVAAGAVGVDVPRHAGRPVSRRQRVPERVGGEG